jgi:hypothetical protein
MVFQKQINSHNLAPSTHPKIVFLFINAEVENNLKLNKSMGFNLSEEEEKATAVVQPNMEDPPSKNAGYTHLLENCCFNVVCEA